MIALALAAALLLAPAESADPSLVGAWSLGGHVLFQLRGDGTGTVEEDPISWSADGRVLVIGSDEGEPERIPYALAGDRLTVTMGGTAMTLQRAGGITASARAGSEARAGAAPPAGNDPLSRLLLSSAWCSFSYNQTTGYSSSERFRFLPDGTWTNGARAEGYSSGGGGTFASQHDSGGQGRWESRAGGNELWMSSNETGGQLVQLPLTVARNSSGSPILTVDGREYSMCQ